MPRFIAFLRAINVGGHVVKMDHLRKILESIGLSNVETFIASGNAIFESSIRNSRTLEGKIAAALQRELGYEVATFIRAPSELSSIASFRPFKQSLAEAGGTRTYIGMVEESLNPTARRIVNSFSTKDDEFCVHGREIYWLCRIPSSESEFSLARLEKSIGMKATFRNSTTIRKLAAKYPE
jgi:uncharacterized protein (DUF1697 family)